MCVGWGGGCCVWFSLSYSMVHFQLRINVKLPLKFFSETNMLLYNIHIFAVQVHRKMILDYCL